MCVCVCVCERERNRERENWCYHYIPATGVASLMLLLPQSWNDGNDYSGSNVTTELWQRRSLMLLHSPAELLINNSLNVEHQLNFNEQAFEYEMKDSSQGSTVNLPRRGGLLLMRLWLKPNMLFILPETGLGVKNPSEVREKSVSLQTVVPVVQSRQATQVSVDTHNSWSKFPRLSDAGCGWRGGPMSIIHQTERLTKQLRLDEVACFRQLLPGHQWWNVTEYIYLTTPRYTSTPLHFGGTYCTALSPLHICDKLCH